MTGTVRDVALALALATWVTLAIVVGAEHLQGRQTTVVFKSAVSGTITYMDPSRREDPMDPSAYIRPKTNGQGVMEGLLRCRRAAVEECEWATRHL